MVRFVADGNGDKRLAARRAGFMPAAELAVQVHVGTALMGDLWDILHKHSPPVIGPILWPILSKDLDVVLIQPSQSLGFEMLGDNGATRIPACLEFFTAFFPASPDFLELFMLSPDTFSLLFGRGKPVSQSPSFSKQVSKQRHRLAQAVIALGRSAPCQLEFSEFLPIFYLQESNGRLHDGAGQIE